MVKYLLSELPKFWMQPYSSDETYMYPFKHLQL